MSKKQSKATKQTSAQRASERAAAIRREQERKERRRRVLVVSVTVLAVVGIIVAIAVGVQSARDATGEAARPPTGVVNKYAVPSGQADAPVEVAIYEDFLCPFCGDFEAASREMLKKYVDAGDVRVRYHVLSFLDRESTSHYSTRAANALGVVLDQAGPEVALKFHNLLYENQPGEGSAGLSDKQLVDYAVEAGATKSDVAGPIESLKFETWVINGSDAASKAGVNQTPTVKVDGKLMKSDTVSQLLSKLTTTIESALN